MNKWANRYFPRQENALRWIMDDATREERGSVSLRMDCDHLTIPNKRIRELYALIHDAGAIRPGDLDASSND